MIVKLPYEVTDKITIEALKESYLESLKDNVSHPDDIKHRKKLKKATKFLLKRWFMTEEEWDEFMYFTAKKHYVDSKGMVRRYD